MNDVIIASKNKGKIKEFESMLSKLNIRVHGLDEFNLIPDVIEDGATFKENAKKKAEEFCARFKLPTIADDSGLVVDYLNGMPGIYSARFAGEGKNDSANNQKLLEQMKGLPKEKRSAKFVCAIALAIPGETTILVEDSIDGLITDELKGSNGFGYDPLFYITEYDKTMAELPLDLKNKISHRSKALYKLFIALDNGTR